MSAWNPPAFPRPGFDNPAGSEAGMSLQEYYAGQALAALIIARPSITAQSAAYCAHDFAGAMMFERSKRS